MKLVSRVFLLGVLSLIVQTKPLLSQTDLSDIRFIRQAVKRMIFSDDQSIPLASLIPKEIIGMASMHPVRSFSDNEPVVELNSDEFIMRTDDAAEACIWLGGFNPFATYIMDVSNFEGQGQIGFQFSDDRDNQFIVSLHVEENKILDAKLNIMVQGEDKLDTSILTNIPGDIKFPGRIILQMLGSGLNLLWQETGLPIMIGQSDFSEFIDLRKTKYFHSFSANLYFNLLEAKVSIRHAESSFTTGLGQADIRAMTYKDGSPFLDQGRLWYTISIRGRALPHHIQGVFSLDPSVFDIRLEGVIVFDRGDGILRNEISSHIFYDKEKDIWQGLTTGFSAYANAGEEKQILAVESKKDPRFGFSIMQARPTGIVGDIEDSHILFDEEAQKWRLLTCENHQGYKAVILESDTWDEGYQRISGPVEENSTGTSIQKIGEKQFCFAGSSAREIFIYSYPDLEKVGTLNMDLPPWDPSSGTRVWPNVVMLPAGYPSRFVALMMDRYNFPGQEGPHWSYGALYLYFGFLDN